MSTRKRRFDVSTFRRFDVSTFFATSRYFATTAFNFCLPNISEKSFQQIFESPSRRRSNKQSLTFWRQTLEEQKLQVSPRPWHDDKSSSWFSKADTLVNCQPTCKKNQFNEYRNETFHIFFQNSSFLRSFKNSHVSRIQVKPKEIHFWLLPSQLQLLFFSWTEFLKTICDLTVRCYCLPC